LQLERTFPLVQQRRETGKDPLLDGEEAQKGVRVVPTQESSSQGFLTEYELMERLVLGPGGCSLETATQGKNHVSLTDKEGRVVKADGGAKGGATTGGGKKICGAWSGWSLLAGTQKRKKKTRRKINDSSSRGGEDHDG